MSEQTENQTNDPTELALEALKKEADALGLEYRSNVSLVKLQSLIYDAKENLAEGKEAKAPRVITKEDVTANIKARALALVRVIITPQNPAETDLQGRMVSVGNGCIGTVRRFIPFNVEWHVEQVLVDYLREQRFQAFIRRKNHLGIETASAKMNPAYAINVLNPLSKAELKELADDQRARQATN